MEIRCLNQSQQTEVKQTSIYTTKNRRCEGAYKVMHKKLQILGIPGYFRLKEVTPKYSLTCSCNI